MRAWLTYHLSAKKDIQFMYRNMKIDNDSFPGGKTQNDFEGSVQEWIGKNVEVQGMVRYEGWKAPIYTYPVLTNTPHNDTTAAVRLTWYPKERDE